MFPGYESGKSFAEYSATPGNIGQSKLNAWVGDSNSAYGKYDPNDRSTWDNAAGKERKRLVVTGTMPMLRDWGFGCHY